ncbi:hypothetical protein [uncultured Dokdonia sp.]|uniref:hypothetical protein n=1 Tax=Dokdonia sp. R78006 TaxID=3093866 RepID=UPI00262320A4|nr:hypothetical protein [uncultured Dokdonia sp.]
MLNNTNSCIATTIRPSACNLLSQLKRFYGIISPAESIITRNIKKDDQELLYLLA